MITIYCIESLDGRKYIGSTNDFERRKSEHLSELRLNIHQNQHLQRYYNKYGEVSLTFFALLEIEDENTRSQIELKCILSFRSNDPKYGFNLTSDTSVTSRFSGWKHSEASLEKIRQSKLGRKLTRESIEKRTRSREGYHPTPETREKIRQSHLGKKHSDESREKMSQAAKRRCLRKTMEFEE